MAARVEKKEENPTRPKIFGGFCSHMHLTPPELKAGVDNTHKTGCNTQMSLHEVTRLQLCFNLKEHPSA